MHIMDVSNIENLILKYNIDAVESKLAKELDTLQQENAQLENMIETSNAIEDEYIHQDKVLSNKIERLENERFNAQYLKKAQLYSKTLNELEENLIEEIEFLESCYDQSARLFKEFTSKDTKASSKSRVETYNKEIKKREKECPAVKNCFTKLEATAAKDTKIANLKEELKLLKELTKPFHGLQPDVQMAKNQLKEIINEYLKVSND